MHISNIEGAGHTGKSSIAHQIENLPSKTGNKSGGKRGNAPPKRK